MVFQAHAPKRARPEIELFQSLRWENGLSSLEILRIRVRCCRFNPSGGRMVFQALYMNCATQVGRSSRLRPQVSIPQVGEWSFKRHLSGFSDEYKDLFCACGPIMALFEYFYKGCWRF